MKHAIVILTVLVFAAAAQAALTVDWSAVATPGLPGYFTHQLSLTTDTGVIWGAGLELTAPGINHVFMGASIYADLNVAMSEPLQDTQVPWRTNIDVLSGPGFEDASTLNADWAFIGGASSPNAQPTVPILQVVLPQQAGFFVTGEALVDGQLVPFDLPGMDHFLVSLVGPDTTVGPGESITLSAIVHDIDTSIEYEWDIGGVDRGGINQGGSWELSYDYLVNTRGLSLGDHMVGVSAMSHDTGAHGGNGKIITIVPEPASATLLAIGFLALVRRRRR